MTEDPTKRSVPSVPALSSTHSANSGSTGHPTSHHPNQEQSPQKVALLALTAMGVVFGDIGTSPLYALRECFSGEHGYTVSPENVYGILSLFFWALAIIISLKYVLFIMRADNRGEGGILALEALARNAFSKMPYAWMGTILTLLGIFGATLLYGDGIITPAISVLSALEGLTVAAPALKPYVVPSTCAVLLVIFLVQRFGTAKIGIIFGPITLLWFAVLGLLGIVHIAESPSILNAMNPMYAARFFMENGWTGFLVLGTVFLCVTGGEAMYADMGHFGRNPIKLGWFFIVWPSLALNYFGQGALILKDPSSISSPFYNMAPSWALYPLIALATAATVIASQALISGVFSLTKQAIQLGFSPRMEIIHTSRNEIGQIYVPAVNWALLIGAVLLVVVFQSSSGLAHAYGVAVSLTMLITTFLAMAVARYVWKWSMLWICILCVPLLIVDVAFFSANAVKIFHGGYIPLVLAAICHFLMLTWIKGRQLLGVELNERSVSLSTFLEEIEARPPIRVPGTAVFMTGAKDGVPFSLVNNLKHNKIVHERVIFVTFVTREIPYVDAIERVNIEEIKNGLWRVFVNIGFMDDSDVQAIIRQVCAKGLWINISDTTFFLGREVVLATHKRGMALWREKLFAFMGKNAQSPAAFFNIPPNQVIEIGMQVEI